MTNFGDMLRARYRVYSRAETVGGVFWHWREGYFDVDAPYQRGLVWTVEQKERLIDSLMSGLGVPPIYTREREILDERPYREVIDGKQRLTSVMGFMSNEFSFNGIWWRDLERPIQRRFESISFPIFVVQDATDEDCWEIFKRVNFCGVPQDEAAYLERLGASQAGVAPDANPPKE